MQMKTFPVPVVPFGPGSQPEGDAVLDYMPMPQAMHTFVAPSLPERADARALDVVRGILLTVLDALDACRRGEQPAPIDLTACDADALRILNAVLGEGEVSARIDTADAGSVLIQETVFAGVWRIAEDGPAGRAERIEVGGAPAALAVAAHAAAAPELPVSDTHPSGVMNAPAILTEVRDQVARWRAGAAPHVINLTLLPLSSEDGAFIDAVLGGGPVSVLSRGYGNCRIASTGVVHCWRIAYFNSQDTLILNTIEITDLPEIVQAAPEDIDDSHERLAQLIDWVEEA
ncbi:TPA: hydrogenase expression/formation protein [Burkholderia vietnamiensis]|jgi:hydrogenase-1 operon protein HyaF|uniref:Hydrogenase expression/formation protein n=1 Tax=Burkholderia vietnamiensis TaxID=60552 RepID=A0AA44Y144_BURVI|nr:hydrogenase expression/formation protein [Burkholderia vietnamiensis]KVF17469.1 hydrogenase expression protein HupH [Burkholderia vietnamiensis]KVS05546.1 hydrogenase expression protein HupH [Burkholderia vietnamiensis]MCA7944540.1 hydrogenase expression/formation protein [Burkholderia vietnamiensis]MCA8209503.1 hydrogenase expression/formation protein [Burkholderia vietnamiensis]MCA8447012.1 hydrogenase expression/formation protein [Burkholderia vietnamiensis]